MKNSTGWVIAAILASISAHTTNGIEEGAWLIMAIAFSVMALLWSKRGN